MANPVGSWGASQQGGSSQNSINTPPMGPPLPPDNPFVQQLAILFPHVPLGELMRWAPKFRDNMLKMLGHAIQQCAQEAKKAARQFKKSIDE